MKNFSLKLLLFAFLFSIAAIPVNAGSAMPKAPAPEAQKTLTKKELRKQKRAEKVANFVKKRMEKKAEKISKKRKKGAFGDWDRNLQLAAIFAAIAIILGILWRVFISSSLTGYGLFATLSGLAWLAAAVFLVLWLIENV